MIYIYGAGKYGKALAEYYSNNGIKISGFLTTEDYISSIEIYDTLYPVYGGKRLRDACSEHAEIQIAVGEQKEDCRIRSLLIGQLFINPEQIKSLGGLSKEIIWREKKKAIALFVIVM